MKINYKQRLFIYVSLICTLFTGAVILVEQSRERNYKVEMLRERLDAYTSIVCHAIGTESRLPSLDKIIDLLPDNIRLTVTDDHGDVLFDNVIKNISTLENHALRPEIVQAKREGKGTDIRVSGSNEQEYVYYATVYRNYFVRTALPCDIRVHNFLKPDNRFFYYVIVLFAVVLLLVNYVANKFGNIIGKLRDFTDSVEKGEYSDVGTLFPRDEQGEIAARIAATYLRLKESEKALKHEHNRLMQHVKASEEGLCFFTASGETEFYNGFFIQYLNMIVDEAGKEPSTVFTDGSFSGIRDFIFSDVNSDSMFYGMTVEKHGKIFAVRACLFDDGSFEIIINDITGSEKTGRLKREMTGNITHELRTPVTSIRGCLETVLEHKLDAEKEHRFIESAYKQTLVLSELIRDLRLITETEEAPESFEIEKVDISGILETVKLDLEIPLRENGISMTWDFGSEVCVKGNRHLLHSIFRNLTDNVIRHAGGHVEIRISKYDEDEHSFYFSYSDTGTGIPEHHLPRLFERFYRINEGRTRDTGGSGLGLSIVKKAVTFHRGTVSVKNRTKGGLELLFNLKK